MNHDSPLSSHCPRSHHTGACVMGRTKFIHCIRPWYPQLAGQGIRQALSEPTPRSLAPSNRKEVGFPWVQQREARSLGGKW